MSLTVSRLPNSWTSGLASEAGQVGKRHTLLQFGHAVFGDLAILHVLRVRQDILGEEFGAGNLDIEGLFQAEDDIEKVDRLGPQITDERRLGRHLIIFDTQSVDQRGFDLLEDLLF